MDNKLIFSLYEKAVGNLELETVFDIINLYGNKCIDGIEINTKNLEYLEKCAMLWLVKRIRCFLDAIFL